jgi:predicted ATPase/class 3 adenylate cyclase
VSGRTELPSGLVTFMFTDIEGSTRLARMLGDAYGPVLGAHRAAVRTALSDFGGVEMFTEGDSFFVAFRDAESALAASVDAQHRLSAHDWPGPDSRPKVRMGLHTGWARPIGDEYASTEVHRAARVAAAAHGGQILCSEATALATVHHSDGPAEMLSEVGLLDLGPYRLRGFDDDERLFQVVAPGLDRDFPRPRTPGAPVHNLPAPLTPLVGRRSEIAEVTDLLGRHRLVTISGPGGAGKSRLALAVAEGLLTAYPQGVWTVEAGGASTGLAPAMAAALGLRTEPGRPVLETLLEQCAGRRMLLVLQTCEVAPGACAALVRRLLAACPGVDVLVTGRMPVGVPGEFVWRIPPLQPAAAFELLDARTIEARGGRPGPAEDQADLAKVAARLEGSPLAIELAAARLRLLSANQLVARLSDPLSALDPARLDEYAVIDRHGSLEANLDWSHRALTGHAAGLLRRLAVFAGPVELGSVEWCGTDALSALSELVDKSLVDVVPGPRYRISEQVRAYASRRLATAGDEREVRDRHLAWSLHTLDGVAVDTDGQPRTVSLTDLAPFVGEWQEALRWAATDGSVRAGLRLADALAPWWREHSGVREGRDLLFRLYRRLEQDGVGGADAARAYLVHAELAADRDERDRFVERAERATDDPALQIRARADRRLNLLEAREHEDAERLCRDVIGQAERGGVPEAALPAVIALAELLWRRDALDEAAELLGAARQLEASRPEDRGRRTVDWLLGMVALRRGDLVAAHDHLVVALRSRLRHGFRGAAADAVAAIAVRCAIGGDAATAAVLFGGAEAARGARRTEMFGKFWSSQQLTLRASLGDTTFDAAYADGAGLGFDRIVAMALAVEHPDLEDGATRFAQTMR